MKPDLITEKLACAALTDAHHWETESPNTSEIIVPSPPELPCELFEEGLGI